MGDFVVLLALMVLELLLHYGGITGAFFFHVPVEARGWGYPPLARWGK